MERLCGRPATQVREGSRHNPTLRCVLQLQQSGPQDKPLPLVAQLLPDQRSGFLTCDCAWEIAWFTHEEINSGVGVLPRHSHSSPPEIQIFIRAYHN